MIPRLVLASASPQRQQILSHAGYVFESVDPGAAEDVIVAAATPEELAAAKARAKARHVAASLPPPYPAVIVAADTIVALDNEIIGKPQDRADAVKILTRLSGKRQRVLTGLCLWPVLGKLLRRAGEVPGSCPQSKIENQKSKMARAVGLGPSATLDLRGESIPVPKLGVATTWLTMRPMTPAQIAEYVASGESDGKAGAYAIQEGGDRFVESLEGSFLNVVGFPLEMFQDWLPSALREWGM